MRTFKLREGERSTEKRGIVACYDYGVFVPLVPKKSRR